METVKPSANSLQRIVNVAVGLADIESAAIFVVGPAKTLNLGAAAGIDGAPLDRLIEAVKDPNHPIALTVRDETSTFDAEPVGAGGPALRSHLPLRADQGMGRVLGVLAVSHEETIDGATEIELENLAAEAAQVLERRAT